MAESLQKAIHEWEDFEGEYGVLIERLDDAEAKMSKEVEMKKNVTEKQDQLNYYQVNFTTYQ